MKTNKMPTTKILIVLSFLSGFLGLAGGGYFIVSDSSNPSAVITGTLIIIGGLLLFAFTRMFANLGQIVFDLNKNMIAQFQILNETSHSQHEALIATLQGQNETSHCQYEALITTHQAQHQTLAELTDTCRQINCDSKEISQDIHRITSFFKAIEKHLKLKK